MEAAGFYDLNVEYELLEKMKETEAPLLFIGLVFNILLLIFIVVSVLLIYSLLLISVETKTFEIGVMRLMGLSKAGFVALVLTEAMCFVLPSIVAGFIFSMPCIAITYSYAFTSDMGFTPSVVPSFGATMEALIVAIAIPCLSAILPIKRALTLSLTDALDTQRQKNQNTLVTIKDTKRLDRIPYILFGTITVGYGLSIYILLPLSLLQMNYTLVLTVFLAILMGMLFGVTILVSNL